MNSYLDWIESKVTSKTVIKDDLPTFPRRVVSKESKRIIDADMIFGNSYLTQVFIVASEPFFELNKMSNLGLKEDGELELVEAVEIGGEHIHMYKCVDGTYRRNAASGTSFSVSVLSSNEEILSMIADVVFSLHNITEERFSAFFESFVPYQGLQEDCEVTELKEGKMVHGDIEVVIVNLNKIVAPNPKELGLCCTIDMQMCPDPSVIIQEIEIGDSIYLIQYKK